MLSQWKYAALVGRTCSSETGRRIVESSKGLFCQRYCCRFQCCCSEGFGSWDSNTTTTLAVGTSTSTTTTATSTTTTSISTTTSPHQVVVPIVPSPIFQHRISSSRDYGALSASVNPQPRTTQHEGGRRRIRREGRWWLGPLGEKRL